MSLFTMHGATYLALKTHDPITTRAKMAGVRAALVSMILFTAGGLWIKNGWVPGYNIHEISGFGETSNPLGKIVTQNSYAWLTNYRLYPWMWAVPALGYGGSCLTAVFLLMKHPGNAFITSAVAQLGVISTAGLSLFPFILPSSSHPNSSLTVWDTSFSHMTLFLMLASVIIFLPLILIYTAWVFRVMRGKVSEEDVLANTQS